MLVKVVSINLGNFSSTGNIAQGIKRQAVQHGIEYVLAYPYDAQNKPQQADDWLIGNRWGRKASVAFGMVTGFNGCFSWFSTRKLLRRMKRFSPDIVHFHNLHNNYINLPMLFRYIKKKDIKVVWTLHDCWSFTGQCPYFDIVECEKWKTGCYACPRYTEYPKSLVDNTKRMWHLKKKWFGGVRDLTIVTPSAWLHGLVKQSFMQAYPAMVINNGIDLSVFRPTDGDLRETYGLTSKKVILGVAFDWSVRKGLDVFATLAERLPEEYQIVLVGADDTVKAALPDSVITISRTKSQQELAQWYTAADVFVNPTREENFPTVNMESLACGTPIITFETGGSPEIIDATTGITVKRNDTDALAQAIIACCENAPFTEEQCVQRAAQFDREAKFTEYIELYENLIS